MKAAINAAQRGLLRDAKNEDSRALYSLKRMAGPTRRTAPEKAMIVTKLIIEYF